MTKEQENNINQTPAAPENGTASKRRKAINVEAKPPITEEKIKQIVNVEYAKTNQIYKIVKQAVDNMTEKLKKPLVDLVGFADESLELIIKEDEKTKKKSYEMSFNLSQEELEFLAIKIPTACMYVQEHINDRALDMSIAEYMFEDAVTENLKSIEGGDAKERIKFATQKAEVEQIVSLVKKQVYANLKTYIDRADKIYEGVKKVLDGKNKERNLFGKANTYSA